MKNIIIYITLKILISIDNIAKQLRWLNADNGLTDELKNQKYRW
jgi:hypothetical protein